MLGDSGIVAQYTPEGVENPLVAPDEMGGCFVIWEDNRSGPGVNEIFAQHLDEYGNRLWAQELYICQDTWTRMLIPDGQGGIIIQANPGGSDFNTHWRISATGQILWARQRLSWYYWAKTVPGEPGFFYLGFDYEFGTYGQRIDVNGNNYWPTWGSGQVGALMAMPPSTNWPHDSEWDDYLYRYPYFYGLYAYRRENIPIMCRLYTNALDIDGNQIMGVTGAQLASIDTGYFEFRDKNIVVDDEGGIQAVWHTLLNDGVYAKRCNADGSLGGPFPLKVTLTPHNPPIQIPFSGGTFSFDIAIADTDSVGGTFDAWIEVTLPTGSTLEILARNDLAIQPDDTLTKNNLLQVVPAGAPAGIYTYTLYAGNYPYQAPWGQDSFTFEKLPEGGPISVHYERWVLDGFFDEQDQIPINSTAQQAPRLIVSPNPFNAETAISFVLPAPTDVHLNVYDLGGRQIALLKRGPLTAGSYTLSWDARRNSSGVYIVRLQTKAGEVAKKILLLR
jgi:hypothetical protein